MRRAAGLARGGAPPGRAAAAGRRAGALGGLHAGGTQVGWPSGKSGPSVVLCCAKPPACKHARLLSSPRLPRCPPPQSGAPPGQDAGRPGGRAAPGAQPRAAGRPAGAGAAAGEAGGQPAERRARPADAGPPAPAVRPAGRQPAASSSRLLDGSVTALQMGGSASNSPHNCSQSWHGGGWRVGGKHGTDPRGKPCPTSPARAPFDAFSSPCAPPAAPLAGWSAPRLPLSLVAGHPKPARQQSGGKRGGGQTG